MLTLLFRVQGVFSPEQNSPGPHLGWSAVDSLLPWSKTRLSFVVPTPLQPQYNKLWIYHRNSRSVSSRPRLEAAVVKCCSGNVKEAECSAAAHRRSSIVRMTHSAALWSAHFAGVFRPKIHAEWELCSLHGVISSPLFPLKDNLTFTTSLIITGRREAGQTPSAVQHMSVGYAVRLSLWLSECVGCRRSVSSNDLLLLTYTAFYKSKIDMWYDLMTQSWLL